MNSECIKCKWQTGCLDNWEGNPKIGITGCNKFENKDKK